MILASAGNALVWIVWVVAAFSCLASALALAPSVYPWYLLWFTPFLFAPLTRPMPPCWSRHRTRIDRCQIGGEDE